MSSIGLGAAFAAVQLVYQAYSKVKSSKARCARLVERCQLVVERLERIAMTKDGDAVIRERIHELERAFGYTAQIIIQVGQQGIIASLLRSETNALQIESCNEALTELISLFNLEETVDIRRWQTELEIARVRDHQELLSMGQRIESGNAAINRELAQQGATLTEVLRVLHDMMNSGLGLKEAYLMLEPFNKNEIRLTSSDTGSHSQPTPTSCTTPPESANLKPSLRRVSFTTNCLKIAPLATVFSKLSSTSPSPSHARSTRAPIAPRRIKPFLSIRDDDNLVDDEEDYPNPDLEESPPPYQIDGSISVEAVRALDSPIPTCPSPNLSSESVFGSNQSLASNFN